MLTFRNGIQDALHLILVAIEYRFPVLRNPDYMQIQYIPGMSCFIYLSRVSIISLYAQNGNILYYKNIRGNKEFTFIPGLKSGVFPFMFDKNYYISLEKSSLSSEESTGAAGTAV